MIHTFTLFSRIVTLTDLSREYPDVQTSISRDTVTGVVLERPEVPAYIRGRLRGVWPRESDPRLYQARSNPIAPVSNITHVTPENKISLDTSMEAYTTSSSGYF